MYQNQNFKNSFLIYLTLCTKNKRNMMCIWKIYYDDFRILLININLSTF